MIIKTSSELLKLKNELRCTGVISLDIETAYDDIDSIFTHRPVMISIHDGVKAYAVDVRKFSDDVIKAFLKGLTKKLVVGHNIKFDASVLRNVYGVWLKNVYDTMLACRVIECGLAAPKGHFSLEQVVRRYVDPYAYTSQGNLFLPYVTKNLRTSFGEGGEFSEAQIAYAELDAEYALRLYYVLGRKAKEMDLERTVKLENDFLNAVVDMELNGLPFDIPTWEANIPIVNEKIGKLEEYLKKVADINWNSDKQVKVVFKQLGKDIITIDRDTLQTKESVSKIVMSRYKDDELVSNYLRYKELKKSQTSYGLKFLRNVDSKTLRIHSNFFQVMDTGRTSSSNPNCQNIPRDENYRKAFQTKDYFIIADYSSQEVRIAADKAEEWNMIKAIKEGEDLHLKTARLVYGDESIQKSDYRRQNAKTMQFTILYGGGAGKIYKQFNVPKKEAQNLIDTYFKIYPGLKSYLEKAQRAALEKGYILINEVSGRKSFIPYYQEYLACKEHVEYFRNRGWDPYPKIENRYRTLHGEICRKASNYPIQGTAADMAKSAGILMLKENLKLVLLVHDEWVIETKDIKDSEIVQRCMEEASKIYLKYLTATAEAVVAQIWKK